MQGSVISNTLFLQGFAAYVVVSSRTTQRSCLVLHTFKGQMSKVNLTTKEKYIATCGFCKPLAILLQQKIPHDNIRVDTDTITRNTQKHTVIDNWIYSTSKKAGKKFRSRRNIFVLVRLFQLQWNSFFCRNVGKNLQSKWSGYNFGVLTNVFRNEDLNIHQLFIID